MYLQQNNQHLNPIICEKNSAKNILPSSPKMLIISYNYSLIEILEGNRLRLEGSLRLVREVNGKSLYKIYQKPAEKLHPKPVS